MAKEEKEKFKNRFAADEPLPRKMRWMSLAGSVIVGILVSWAAHDVIWGFVAFLVSGIGFNAIALWRIKKP